MSADQTPEAAPTDIAEDTSPFDRPMRDAPSPRRWAPVLLVLAGAGVAVWAGLSMLAPARRTALPAPPAEEVEYSTGVALDEAAPAALPEAPRRPATARVTALASSAGRDGADAERLADARRHAPVLIVGGGRGPAPARSAEVDVDTAPATAPAPTRASRAAIASAERPGARLDALLPEGAFIAATLETAIQSDLPGSIRAVVARDVYAADATRLLVPRGARLIGHYRAGLVRGQSRVFAVWTRIVRPDGVSIALEAPATDGAGRAGASGRRDGHFFERFGAAVLLSLIDGVIAAQVADAGSPSEARIAVDTGRDFSRAAEIALENSIAIPPTVHVVPGARLQVFVNRDIDFSGVLADPWGAGEPAP